MVLAYYYISFIVALLLTIIYLWKWNKHFNVWITICFVLAPIVNLSHLMMSEAQTLEGAYMATKLDYLSGCFLQPALVLCAMTICGIKLKKPILGAMFSVSILIFLSVAFESPYFYKEVSLGSYGGVTVLNKEYGPIHTLFFALVIGYMILAIVTLIYAFARKKQISLSLMLLMVCMDIVDVGCYLARMITSCDIEFLCAGYDVSLILLLALSIRISLYSVDDSVTDSLVEHGNIGFFTFNNKRQFLASNATAVEFFPEIATLKVDKVMPKEELFERVERIFDEIDRLKKEGQNSECVRKYKKIDKIYKLTADYIYRGKKTFGYIVRMEDITAEEHYVKMREQYAEDMEKLKQEADRANSAKSIFLANMSHEIRTPMNAVLGMNELILRDSKDPAIREYAADIENSGRALLTLINEILDFSKIESGKMEIIPESYQVKDMVSGACNMVRLKAEEKGIQFRVEMDHYMPSSLYGDEARIRQIAINLLTNAVKYTSKGSVTMEIGFSAAAQEEDHKDVEGQMPSLTSGSKGILTIRVKDTGAGIKPESMDKLFDSYKRVDEERTKYIEGTGLGLSITKQLLTMMGGDITVESQYGEGSVFTVRIPQEVVDAQAAGQILDQTESLGGQTPKKEAEGNPCDFAGVRILAVDDSPMNLKLVGRFLADTGATIDYAKNGIEAIDKIRNNQYHVILMDHMMPEMDGIEAVKKARAEDGDLIGDTPVVMLTANAIGNMREKYLADGFTDYISKPFKMQELRECIKRNLK